MFLEQRVEVRISVSEISTTLNAHLSRLHPPPVSQHIESDTWLKVVNDQENEEKVRSTNQDLQPPSHLIIGLPSSVPSQMQIVSLFQPLFGPTETETDSCCFTAVTFLLCGAAFFVALKDVGLFTLGLFNTPLARVVRRCAAASAAVLLRELTIGTC